VKKNSEDRERLAVCNKKVVTVLVVGYFVYVYTIYVRLCKSCLYLNNVIISWELTKRADFVAQSFM